MEPSDRFGPDAVSRFGSDRSAQSFSEALKSALASGERPASPRTDPWNQVPALGVIPARPTLLEPTAPLPDSLGTTSAAPVAPHETTAFWPDLGGLMSGNETDGVKDADDLVLNRLEPRGVGRAEWDSREAPPPTPPPSGGSMGLVPPLGMEPAAWGDVEPPDLSGSAADSTPSTLTPAQVAASSADLGEVSFSGLDAPGLTAPLVAATQGPTEGIAADDSTPTSGAGSSHGLDPWSLAGNSGAISTSDSDLSRVDLGADVPRAGFFAGGNGLATDGGAAADDLGGGTGVGAANPSLDPFRGASSAARTARDDAAALDLARTNDLLQQLLDEARKGRTSFLPTHDRNSEYLYQSS